MVAAAQRAYRLLCAFQVDFLRAAQSVEFRLHEACKPEEIRTGLAVWMAAVPMAVPYVEAGRDIGADRFVKFSKFRLVHIALLVDKSQEYPAADVHAHEVGDYLVMYSHRRADGAALAAVDVGHYRD